MRKDGVSYIASLYLHISTIVTSTVDAYSTLSICFGCSFKPQIVCCMNTQSLFYKCVFNIFPSRTCTKLQQSVSTSCFVSSNIEVASMFSTVTAARQSEPRCVAAGFPANRCPLPVGQVMGLGITLGETSRTGGFIRKILKHSIN